MKLFIILLIIVIGASFGIASTEFREDKLMTNYVSVKEVISELKFTIYTEEEWQEFFEEYKEPFLTRGMVFDILAKVGTAKVIPFDEVGKQNAIDRQEWNHIYEQLIDYLDIENLIRVEQILILGSEVGENRHSIYTNQDTYFTNLPTTYFEPWKSYEVYMLGTECVGIVGETENVHTIENVYITRAAENRITFLFDGRTYEKDVNLGGQSVFDGVADISVSNQKITVIAQKQDYIEGHLLSYDDTTIEIEGYGRIAHAGKLPVYRAYDKVEQLAVSDIILGNMDVKYVIGENEVCAILITAPAEISQVRVLLLNDEGGKFRENVFLQSDTDIVLTCGSITETITAGNVVDVKQYLKNVDETLVFEPLTNDSLIYLCKENGKKQSNGYSGKMEVRLYENGYCVVNEVDFETYLYSVVPSEMPSNYHPEALKVQAVCARSYAYMQVVRADLAAYGAHINDSSSYQVYNNINKTKASINAVDETAGMVMLYEGDVIEAYYFSTSMGYTDTEEIWNPIDGTDIGYLKKACLNHQAFEGDMSKEEEFKEYLMTDATGYDSDIKFYRWQIEADYRNLTDEIKDILKTRRAALTRHITYYKLDKKSEGMIETDSMKNFGELKSFEVAKRSASGSVLELMVHFENGSVKVENEYNIRKILGCGMTGITYKDGSKGKVSSLIPSAFCTVELQEDGTYLLCGGGYGHGIGMSQNGANGMAKAGYNYIEILNFFYKDIELVDIRS